MKCYFTIDVYRHLTQLSIRFPLLVDKDLYFVFLNVAW